MTRWSVVIASARSENLIRSVGSLLETHPDLEPSRIVVVDDGARAGAEEHLPRGIRWVEGARPFVWARNINLGVRAVEGPAFFLIGDDVEIETLGGLDQMAEFLLAHPELGVLSAGVHGIVGNPHQRWNGGNEVSLDEPWLAFVAVMIPSAVWKAAGPLDERFGGYGCDDVDYSWRLREKGFRLGVLRSVIVRHDGSIPSTFRTRPDIAALSEENHRLLLAKWSGRTSPP